VEPPETRYALSGDVHIAYQVTGDGPFDLVYVPPFVSNVELAWKVASTVRLIERLSSFSRLIRFDKRGTGMSDRVEGVPTLETRMDDVRAVMDAAGSDRAALLGASEGGPMCALFAATYPSRCWALALFATYASERNAPDYLWESPTRTSAPGSNRCVRGARSTTPVGSRRGCIPQRTPTTRLRWRRSSARARAPEP